MSSLTPEPSPKSKHKLKKLKESLTPRLSRKKKRDPQQENCENSPSHSDSKGNLAVPSPHPLTTQEDNEDTTVQRKVMMHKFMEYTKGFLPGPVPKHLRRESTAGYKMQKGGIRLSTMMDRRLNLRPVILTIEQIAEYEDAFSKFDVNNDGTMSVDELHKLLRNIGLKPSG